MKKLGLLKPTEMFLLRALTPNLSSPDLVDTRYSLLARFGLW